MYEVDSDNILGITTFLLCRVSEKLQEIYIQLLFLRIIFGDNIYYGMDSSSYVYSTIIGAMEFMEKKESYVEERRDEVRKNERLV